MSDTSPEGTVTNDFSSPEIDTLPISWPRSVKVTVLAIIVSHATMASWVAAAFIPAFLQMSKDLGRPLEQITYLVGVYTLFLGFGSFVWNPLADRIGARPMLLISLVISIVSSCGAAVSPTYGTLMTARVFQGFGLAAPLSLGVPYIKEMYPPANRGVPLGGWTLGITTGPFIAPLICGFVANLYYWRFILWLQAIMLAFLFIIEIVFLPEVLKFAPGYRYGSGNLFLQLPWNGTPVKEKGSPQLSSSADKAVKAVLNPATWLSGLAFAVPYGFISVALSSMFPLVYGQMYKFQPSIQGLLYIPMLVGSILAELFTGRLGDRLTQSSESTLTRRPERRLIISQVGAILSIAGLIWFGVSVQNKLHWAVPAVGTGVASFGSQMITSTTFSYIVDCYPFMAKEVITVMNVFRVLSSFVVLFYNQRLVAAVGFGWGFGVQCFIIFVFSTLGLVVLGLLGPKLRPRELSKSENAGAPLP